jgi:regulator of protease activity HflC (stomatin/prohibitin superfamily)
MPIVGFGLLIPVALVVFWFLSGIRIVNEYEQGVVLRLGRFSGIRSAGLKWIIPFIDRMIIIDMRVTAEQVPPQDVITRDNVSVKVNAVIYFRVMQADRAFLQVTRPRSARCSARSSSTTSSASATRSTGSSRRSSTATPSRGA